MNVKIKKYDTRAVIPSYAKDGDAGMDLTCVLIEYTDDYIEYDTQLAFSIPNGFVGLLFPRSSNSKKDLLMCNSVGVIDSSYRGTVKFRYKHITNNGVHYIGKFYDIGDKVGQLIIIPYPNIELEEVDELDETDRGSGGFGHTGK